MQTILNYIQWGLTPQGIVTLGSLFWAWAMISTAYELWDDWAFERKKRRRSSLP